MVDGILHLIFLVHFLSVTVPLVCHFIHFPVFFLFTLKIDHHLQEKIQLLCCTSPSPALPCTAIYPIDLVQLSPSAYYIFSAFPSDPEHFPPHTECSEQSTLLYTTYPTHIRTPYPLTPYLRGPDQQTQRHFVIRARFRRDGIPTEQFHRTKKRGESTFSVAPRLFSAQASRSEETPTAHTVLSFFPAAEKTAPRN